MSSTDDIVMKQKTFQLDILWHLVIILISVLCLVSISPTPAFALALSDYFSYSYDIELSQTEVHGDDVFHAAVNGQATCESDLPLPITEAYVAGRIVAQHQTSGTKVVVNPGYTLEVGSPPNKKGETVEASVVVPLAFPEGSQPGNYTLIGELIEAKVRVIVWIDVTSYLPSSQADGSVTYVAASGGGSPGGGGGGGNGSSNYIDSNGRFLQDITVESADGKMRLSIGENTIGLTTAGEPLSEMTIVEMTKPPMPPKDANVIGLVYDLAPDDATFDPPATLTISYDPAEIPEGLSEQNLVIAFWDVDTGEWVVLEDCSVDTTAHTISVPVSHFTPFTVLAVAEKVVLPPVVPKPAAFTTSDLTISPAEVHIGDTVTISILVTNTGDLPGTYEVVLKMDEAVVGNKWVTLDGGASQKVTFTVSKDVAGTYAVRVGDRSRTLVVKEVVPLPPPAPATFTTGNLVIIPAEVGIGETVAVSVLVANAGDVEGTYQATLKIDGVVVDTKEITLAGGASQAVTFTVSKDVAGTYAVRVNNLAGTLVVKEVAPVVLPKPMNWWLIACLITACIILGVGTALLVRYRGSRSRASLRKESGRRLGR